MKLQFPDWIHRFDPSFVHNGNKLLGQSAVITLHAGYLYTRVALIVGGAILQWVRSACEVNKLFFIKEINTSMHIYIYILLTVLFIFETIVRRLVLFKTYAEINVFVINGINGNVEPMRRM